MASTTDQLYALSKSSVFQTRLASFMNKKAAAVLVEGDGVANHDNRLAFAKRVLASPIDAARSAAPRLAFSDNVAGAGVTTTYDFVNGVVVSSVLDADLESQVNSLWDELSNN